MEEYEYSNYLQLFASKNDLGKKEDIINRLTAARKEFIKRCEKIKIEEKIPISEEIIDKYELDDLKDLFDMSYDDFIKLVDKILDDKTNKTLKPLAIDFAVNILDKDVKEFSDFVSYIEELSKKDKDKITEEEKDKDELITFGISSYDRYDHYLMHGSTIDKTTTTAKPLFDISNYLSNYSEDEISEALPSIDNYYKTLLDIGNYIEKTSNALTPREEIKEDYQDLLNRQDILNKILDNYNSTLNNKVTARLFKKDREKAHPEIILDLLTVQALNQFEESGSLKTLYSNYNTYYKNNRLQKIKVYQDQGDNKYLDKETLMALLGENEFYEYKGKNNSTYITTKDHVIEKGLPEDVHLDKEIEPESLKKYKYDKILKLYKVSNEELEELIELYEKNHPGITIQKNIEFIERTKEDELNEMFDELKDNKLNKTDKYKK